MMKKIVDKIKTGPASMSSSISSNEFSSKIFASITSLTQQASETICQHKEARVKVQRRLGILR